MIKHYVFVLDPSAKHEWNRCDLRDPLTAKRPDLAKIIADAIGEASGSYLVSVNIEVTVLDQIPLPQGEH